MATTDLVLFSSGKQVQADKICVQELDIYFFGRQRLTFWIKMASKKKTKIGRKCQCSNYLSLTSLITIFSNAMTLVYYIDLGSYNMK